MRHFVIFSIFFSILALAPFNAPRAQDNLPALPDALNALVEQGAQMRYLGKKHGMDGWVAIYQGEEQYYYVTPNGDGFIMGLLFDRDGGMATIEQVRDLQRQSDDVLDFLAVDKPDPTLTEAIRETNEAFEYKTPAERMFQEVENSNWVQFGADDAPVIYSFMDPQCPHCHSFMGDLREGYIEKGLIQLRMIPVGFRDETLSQAAFLLAAPDAKERWYAHLDGDESALPAKQGTNTQGIQRNLALMQSWKFDVTPMTVYRGKDGKVKIIRGRAENMSTLLADLPTS
jgi:thiol:disulfide interchange protein DsbG